MKKLLNFRPVFFLAISCVLGILLPYLFAFKAVYVPLILLFAIIVCFILLLIFSKKNRKVYAIFSVIFAVIMGIGSFNYSARINSYEKADLYDFNATVNAKVVDLSVYDNYTRLILDKITIFGLDEYSLNKKMCVYVYDESLNVDLGDRIEFYATINDKSLTYEGRFIANDIAENIKYTASVSSSDIKVIGRERNVFEVVHVFIRDSLKSGLSDKEFSLAYGMLLGNTDTMEEDILSNFRALGVAHIFAVSGLHIGFLATVVGFILKRLKIPNVVKIIITAFILIFYSGVCGFSSSSLRAVVMSITLISLNYAGKKYDGLSTIGLAALIILTISPIELFRVGFQLSFIVVIGLITCSKLFAKPFSFLGKKFSSLIGGVISAQLFSFPICLIYFGQVSILSVIANLILLPIMSFVFIFLLVSTLIGGIFGISYIALFLSEYLLKAMIFLGTAFNYQSLTIGGITLGGITITYYLTWFILAGYFNVKKITKIITSIALSLIFVIGSIILTVKDNNKATLIITTQNKTHACLIVEKDLTLLVVASLGETPNFNKIERALNSCGETSIDKIIMLESCNIDYADSLILSAKSVCKVNAFYYSNFNDKNVQMHLVALHNDVEIVGVENYSTIISGGVDFKYLTKGYAVSLRVKNSSINIYGNYKNTLDLPEVNHLEKVDYLIASNWHDYFKYNQIHTERISFLEYSDWLNAESNGNVVFKIY